MKSRIPLRIKLIIFLATVLVLLLFRPFSEQEKSRQENDFDSWLSASAASFSRGAVMEGNTVQIKLRSTDPEKPLSLQLQTSGNADMNRKLYRLLRQAQEASLFELNRTSKADLMLEVKEGDRMFVSRFSVEDLKKNVKIANFMRLFQEFASEPMKAGSNAS